MAALGDTGQCFSAQPGLSHRYSNDGDWIASGLRFVHAGVGVFSATFAFSFGLSQFVIGIALDFYGLRRTWLCTFPLAILGALTSALAPNYAVLVFGQALIGIGCSPAFVVCTLFIARRFPVQRFAAISGVAMGMGGLGLVLMGQADRKRLQPVMA